MRIGIDISQICYEGTGVARYVREMTKAVVSHGRHHEFILFAATLRKRAVIEEFYAALRTSHRNLRLVLVPVPPTMLHILWNVLHIIPIEWLTGKIDVFWSSDWMQPPLRSARGVTTVHDMIVSHYPEEMHRSTEFTLAGLRVSPNIVAVQRCRLHWVVKECAAILCDSVATKEDVMRFLGIEEQKLFVVYPGAPDAI